MSDKTPTAVGWLLKEWSILESQIPPRIINQALEMEKQQIINAYDSTEFYLKGTDYYTDTYKP